MSVVIFLTLIEVISGEAKDLTRSVENRVVFHEEGRFAGWPVNPGALN